MKKAVKKKRKVAKKPKRRAVKQPPFKQATLVCDHNDNDGFPDCSKEPAFRHPDRDGDFYYCAEHREGCPLCQPMR